jgi:hypothetical protein
LRKFPYFIGNNSKYGCSFVFMQCGDFS